MNNFVKDRNDIHLVSGLIICLASILKEVFIPSDFNYYFNDFHPNIIDPVYDYFNRNQLLRIFTSYLILVLNGLYLELLNRKHSIISSFTRLPFVIYIIFVISFIPLQYQIISQIGTFLFIFAIDKVYSTHNMRKLVFNYFDAAFFISVAALLHPKFIFLQFFVIAALLFLRTFRWREWILTLMGVILPFVFQWALSYAFNWETKWNFKLFAYPEVADYLLTVEKIPALVSWFLLIILGSYQMAHTIQKKKVGSRRFFLIFFVLFIVSILGILSSKIGFEIVFILGIPVAFLVSHYLMTISAGLAKLFYVILFIFALLPLVMRIIS